MTEDERSARTSPGSAAPKPGSPQPGERDRERPPPGVHAMALVRWALVALMAVIALLSVSHSFGLIGRGPAGAVSVQYYCPMHPQVVQSHPGECPICSMTLVEKETRAEPKASDEADAAKSVEPEQHAAHAHDAANPSASAQAPSAVSPVPGLVPIELSLDRIQNIGVRTTRAIPEALAAELRAVGIVSVDESRLARVHTRFSGWIEQLEVASAGQKVSRGQVLARLYNLELLPAQQEFLAARHWSSSGAASTLESSAAGASIERDARARLELFGLSNAEIDAIAESGRPHRSVAVVAPIAGYVLSKNAVQGAFVGPNVELFEIADLSRIWVLVDIHENDVGRLRLGQGADVSVGAYPGERFSGTVTFLSPTVDASTRTLRVRVELSNRGMKLRPGMYADAALRLDAAQGIVIPVEALVDTGAHQYVFVVQQGGRFEPRKVTAGQRVSDKVQILEGLASGEVVVTTANFLIDSESRLQAAIQAPAEMAPPKP